MSMSQWPVASSSSRVARTRRQQPAETTRFPEAVPAHHRAPIIHQTAHDLPLFQLTLAVTGARAPAKQRQLFTTRRPSLRKWCVCPISTSLQTISVKTVACLNGANGSWRNGNLQRAPPVSTGPCPMEYYCSYCSSEMLPSHTVQRCKRMASTLGALIWRNYGFIWKTGLGHEHCKI
jgi:hypothetical protein